MLGNNPARRQQLTDGQTLWIQEVYYTLQGEGPFSGEPAVFIRTAGCNLKCYWCDTEFESSAWHPTLDDLLRHVDEVRPSFTDLVVVTGGEPFRQNIRPLVIRLLERGFRVEVDTNGTLWVDLPDDPRLYIVCSPKTKNIERRLVSRVAAFKYAIAANETDPQDGLPITSTQKPGVQTRLYRPPPNSRIFVLPLEDGDRAREVENRRACTRTALAFGYRLCLQVHKVLEIG